MILTPMLALILAYMCQYNYTCAYITYVRVDVHVSSLVYESLITAVLYIKLVKSEKYLVRRFY